MENLLLGYLLLLILNPAVDNYSSTKSRTAQETLEGRSLMYARNGRGPSTVPFLSSDVTAVEDVFSSMVYR